MINISANVETLLKRTNGLEEKLENLFARIALSEDLGKTEAESFLECVHILEQKVDDLETSKRRNNPEINGLNEPPNESPSSLSDKVPT